MVVIIGSTGTYMVVDDHAPPLTDEEKTIILERTISTPSSTTMSHTTGR